MKLDELILDLHETTRRRGRRIAEDLDRALQRIGRIPALTDEVDRRLRNLDEVRAALSRRVQALHEIRSPWNVSVYDTQVQLLGVPILSRSSVRLQGRVLQALNEHAYLKAGERLQRFIELGGLNRVGTTSWASALEYGTILDKQDVQDAQTALIEARAALPAALSSLDRLITEIGLEPLPSLRDGFLLVSLVHSVRRTLQVAGSDDIYRAPLEELLEDLSPRGNGWLWLRRMVSPRFWRARPQARALFRNPPASYVELIGRLRVAAQERAEWAELRSGMVPFIPAEFSRAEPALHRLKDAVGTLCRWLGVEGLLNEPPTRVSVVLDRLDAERDTLRRLPELHDLRSELITAGLGSLLKEVRSFQ